MSHIFILFAKFNNVVILRGSVIMYANKLFIIALRLDDYALIAKNGLHLILR